MFIHVLGVQKSQNQNHFTRAFWEKVENSNLSCEQLFIFQKTADFHWVQKGPCEMILVLTFFDSYNMHEYGLGSILPGSFHNC